MLTQDEHRGLMQQLESCKSMMAAHPQGSPAWEAAYSQGCRVAAILEGRAKPHRPAPARGPAPAAHPTVAVGGTQRKTEVDPRFFDRPASEDARYGGRREEPVEVVDPRRRVRGQPRPERAPAVAPAPPRAAVVASTDAALRRAPAIAPTRQTRPVPRIRFASPAQLGSWLGAAATLTIQGVKALRTLR